MIKEEKKRLRKETAEKRAALSKEYMETAVNGITQAVIHSEVFKESRYIFIFISMPGEPDTRGIIEEAWKQNKTVCVPKCYPDRQMTAYIINSFDDLESGAYGIMEPYDTLEKADEAAVDLSFIPCISANRKGQRIGHGGGYYDIFLERSRSRKLCLCFEKLTADPIPVAENDQPMDYIATENGLFKCGGINMDTNKEEIRPVYKKFRDIELSTLGMGNMRLPCSDPTDHDSPIDFEKGREIVRKAYQSGINYFDTAYVYNSGDSEKCVGEALGIYDRNSYYLATKYFIGATEDYKGVFEEQLKRLQTDHIDFYLLHCIMDKNAESYINSGAIEYFADLKEQGKITYLGFSSHSSPETLRKFASLRQWDFAQIQMNYYDWEFGTAREEYDILTEKNIPVIVMEPLRGGALAKLCDPAEDLLKAQNPDLSKTDWAFRFIRSHENVQLILSGMNTFEMIEENVKTFSTADGLTDREMEVLSEAAKVFKNQVQVPCTGCRYCCSGCPEEINIPEFLKIYNDYKVQDAYSLARIPGVQSKGKPGDCIKCKACMNHCPQSINIPDYLEELVKLAEN